MTLASRQGFGLWSVAAAEDHVYWTTENSVVSAAITGGTPTTLATTPDAQPQAVAVDATYVYWLGNRAAAAIEGVVMKVPREGGTPINLASAEGEPNDIAVGATNVYWTMGLTQGGSLIMVGLNGGTPTILDSGPAPFGSLVLDASNVYYFDGGGNLMKMPLGGGTPVTLVSNTGANLFGEMSVDSSNVYWATGSAIMSVSLGGGAPETLVSGLTSANNLAADGSWLYWIDSYAYCEDGGPCGGNGTVMTAPLNGGAPTTLFSGPELNGAALAVSSSGIFWTSRPMTEVMWLPFE